MKKTKQKKKHIIIEAKQSQRQVLNLNDPQNRHGI